MVTTITFRRQNLTPAVLRRHTHTDKCIILDLDETLVHTFEDLSEYNKLKPHKDPRLRPRTYHLDIPDDPHASAVTYKVWGVTRPHVHEFLEFCFSYFKIVAVWSAGLPSYVDEIVDTIFPIDSPPHLIFTRSDCEMIDDVTKKSLFKMIESEPLLNEVMTPGNTFVVDDRCDVWDVCPYNVVQIPEYRPDPPTLDRLLTDNSALDQLRWWLMTPEVVSSEDTRLVDKSTIFLKSVAEYRKQLSSVATTLE